MEAFFCDGCSRRVTEGELADGDGVHVGDMVFCKYCCEQPAARDYLESVAVTRGGAQDENAAPSRSGSHRAVGRGTPHRGHRRVRAKSPHRRKRPTPGPGGGERPSPPRGGEGRRVPARPARPVSPVPDEASSIRSAPLYGSRSADLCKPAEIGRAPRRRARPLMERRNGAYLVLWALAGTTIGFVLVAVASKLLLGS